MGIERNKKLSISSSVSVPLFKQPNQLLFELSKNNSTPCISIYLSTHRYHPDNAKDPIQFNELINEVVDSIQDSSKDIKTLLAPLYNLKDDRNFWNHTLDGLAIFLNQDLFKVCKLQRSVPNLAIVSNSFHIKPLMRYVQTADRYQVLSLNSREIRLFEGNRDVLDEIDLAAGVPRNIEEALGVEIALTDKDSEKFYRVIDQAILEHHSRSSGLPLFLASLPENQARFRAISRNPFLMNEGLALHGDTLTNKELRDHIWLLVKPFYDARIEELIEVYNEAESKKLGSKDISQVAKAALNGRVSTLLIESGRLIPGHLNHKTGTIESEKMEQPLVDDLGECVENNVKSCRRVLAAEGEQRL